MKRSILLLATALSFAGCGQSAKQGVTTSSDASGIVNGKTAVEADVASAGVAQSVVMIITQLKDGQALCTGTLIDPRIVLTAGHCVGDGAKPADVIVILHALNPDQLNSQTPPANISGYRVQDFTLNPAFSGQGMNNQDVAILLLEKPVVAGTPIATLPDATLNYTALPQIMTIGYGVSDDRHTTTQDKSGAGTLRYTTFPNDKFEILPSTADVGASSQGMLVALADTTSMCNGDSGGPVMALSAKGQSSNMVVAVNESVIARYQGQEETDFEAAMKANNPASFYAKYPDAPTCSGGYNLAVNTVNLLPWITSVKTALLAEPAPVVVPTQTVAAQPAK